jgi:hypothetical protein
MLANQSNYFPQVGALRGDVQKPATFRHELVDFIANELPLWRSRPDRKHETAETALTSQLCAHLNSVARHSPGWDILQFRVEEPDEQQRGRKIDLVASPSGTSITIEGRKHADFDPIMPIECKRLPTPKAKDRDEREYVITEGATTGGIQRFKAGHHGAAHNFGAMIGYVQEEDTKFWNERIGGWIGALADKKPGWTSKDLLQLRSSDEAQRTATLGSSHTRNDGLADIELCHLWIKMN